MRNEKIWVSISDQEKGTGQASYMVRVLKRKGIQAHTDYSPYFGYTSVAVKIVPTKKNLQKVNMILKRETGDGIDVDGVFSNIRRGVPQ